MRILLCFGLLITSFGAFSSAKADETVREPDRIYYPSHYNPAQSEKLPLIVLLHAFKVSGNFQKFYFGLGRRMNRDRFILFVPGSIKDSRGHRIWNSMTYCCNYYNLPVDDVGYLKNAIEQVIQNNPVDKSRVYLMGHSNGAMMAHRMACEHADLFAAIVSLAGSGMTDLAQCKPSSPVSILEIHAMNDKIVYYDGMDEEALDYRLSRHELYPYFSDPSLVRYPSAQETIEDWAKKDGCDLIQVKTVDHVNYAMTAWGRETSKQTWDAGCANGTSVSLWTLRSGGHVPRFNGAFQNAIVDFLLSKKK